MEIIPITGYHEARAEERQARDAAFLDLNPARVCGVPVRPLTLRRYLTLSIAGSPFIHGGAPDREDALAFLWAVSPQYTAQTSPVSQGWFPWRNTPRIRPVGCAARRRFVESLSNVPTEDLDAGVRDFLAAFMDDAPGGSGDGSAPIASDAAYLIDAMLSRYHQMTEAEVLDMRMDRLWQQLRVIRQINDSKAVFFNKRSDRARKAGVARYRAQRRAAAEASAVANTDAAGVRAPTES